MDPKKEADKRAMERAKKKLAKWREEQGRDKTGKKIKKKRCSNCGQLKRYSKFYKQSSRLDGYAKICKKCFKKKYYNYKKK